MPERVRITDVSPRDGLQNEPGIIPTADKVRLIELLCQTGVDEIEVTSFVNPKWVPQLGDAAEVCAALPPPPRGRGQGGGLSPIPIAAHSPPFPINPPDRDPLRDPRALSHAQSLRRAMTGPEQLLWAKLRNRQVHGVKFRRQHPVGPYILDFYAMTHHLAIEVEGQTHAGAEVQASDRERTEYLAHFGVRVLRFTNDDVVRDVESVVRTIAAVVLGKQGVGVDGRVLVGKAEKPTPRPPPSGRGGEIYSSLVPNEHGLRAAFEVNRRAGYPLIEKVSVFTAASETFSRKNTNATIAETIERFKPVVAGAEDEGLEVRGYISCVVACPFEGPIAPAKVAEVAARLLDLGIEEIDLGDTIGTGTRESVGNMLEAVLPVVESERGPTPPPPPSGRGGWVTLHLHDTFGRAAECVKAALDLGVRSFDGSVAGLGGCPYASTPGKRAPGNISTESLVRTVHEAGFETGVDLDALERAAAFAREIVAKSRAAAGGSP